MKPALAPGLARPCQVLTGEQVARLDRITHEITGLPTLLLMERAALAVVHEVQHWQPRRVVVLAGSGNNGGDGYAAARMLQQAGVEVVVAQVGGPPANGDAHLQLPACDAVGVTRFDAADEARLGHVVAGADVIVDAVLGTGLRLPLRSGAAAALRIAAAHRQPDARVIAVDVPSGVDADTGQCAPETLAADTTVTFGALRWGHLTGAGVDFVGRLVVADIGLLRREWGDEAVGVYPAHECTPALPPLRRSDYKGTRGHLLVHAGSERYPGAGALAARAALQSGAGLVSLVADSEVGAQAASHAPELIHHRQLPQADELAPYSAFLVGPGLLPDTAEVSLQRLRPVLSDRPVILDAGALEALQRVPDMRGANVVLTPHPGELARLLRVSLPEVLANLPAATAQCARIFDCVVVTKSTVVLVAEPGSPRTLVVEPGHHATGRGGAGDVLAGAIAGLSAHRHHGLMQAIVHAATAHARASHLAWSRNQQADFTPTDLSAHLPAAIAALRTVDRHG